MRIQTITFVLVALLLFSSTVEAGFRALVLVYDASMKGLAAGVVEILASASSGEEDFMVVSDPHALASLLALPNVRCVVLTSVNANDLKLLAKPVTLYFEAGGSAIGFHGCGWQSQLGDMARIVFPVFGNATGIGSRKGGKDVNEYSRDSRVGGIGEELPDEFDIVGQFYAYAGDRQKGVLEVQPPGGNKAVLFREKSSGAPLVVANQGDPGGRSVAFTGLFVRDNPTATNHYERLLEQPEFAKLLVDSYLWVSEGNSRFSEFSANYQESIDQQERTREHFISLARQKTISARNRRIALLAVFWALGLLSIAVLARWTLLRRTSG